MRLFWCVRVLKLLLRRIKRFYRPFAERYHHSFSLISTKICIMAEDVTSEVVNPGYPSTKSALSKPISGLLRACLGSFESKSAHRLWVLFYRIFIFCLNLKLIEHVESIAKIVFAVDLILQISRGFLSIKFKKSQKTAQFH